MTTFCQTTIPPARVGRIAACLGVLLLPGCVFVPRPEDLPPEPTVAAAPPPADEAPAPAPAPEIAAPVTRAEPAPPPPAEPPPPPPPKVVLLAPAETGSFEPMMTELERLLAGHFPTERVATSDQAQLAELAAPVAAAQPVLCVVAVGSEAARIAIEELQLPTVFSQVPDQEFVFPEAYGVATTPPPALQLAAWRQLDPTLGRVGLILSGDEYLLAAQALKAAAEVGIELELRTAASDQEAVYLFKRMAGGIDGLWLLPDNAILSPRAIREMLEHATQRRVQSLVFTPALLDWGAVISVAGTPRNVAATLADVVERIGAGDSDDVPPITPLSELEIRINPQVADRLGLSPPAEIWIVSAWGS